MHAPPTEVYLIEHNVVDSKHTMLTKEETQAIVDKIHDLIAVTVVLVV